MSALLAVAITLMLVGAALLVADVGSSGLWIAAIAVGIAIVAVVGRRGIRTHR